MNWKKWKTKWRSYRSCGKFQTELPHKWLLPIWSNITVEYTQLKGTCKGHQLQLLALYRTTQNPSPMPGSVIHILLQLWWLGAVPKALGSLCHAHCRLLQALFPNPHQTLPWHNSMSFIWTTMRSPLICSGLTNPRDGSYFSCIFPSSIFAIFVAVLLRGNSEWHLVVVGWGSLHHTGLFH